MRLILETKHIILTFFVICLLLMLYNNINVLEYSIVPITRPPTNPDCTNTLKHFCGNDIGNVNKCKICAGDHQSELKQADCLESDIEFLCSQPEDTCIDILNEAFPSLREGSMDLDPSKFTKDYITKLNSLSGKKLELQKFVDCVNEPNFLKNLNLQTMLKMFKDVDFSQKELQVLNISNWDTSDVIDMRGTFENNKFTGKESRFDISKWNVSNVYTMDNMFKNAINFDGELNAWSGKLSELTSAESMFEGAKNFSGRGLITWFDISYGDNKLENLYYMFLNATNLGEDLSHWKLTKVQSYINCLDAFNGSGLQNRKDYQPTMCKFGTGR
jgi:surface protein